MDRAATWLSLDGVFSSYGEVMESIVWYDVI